MTGTVHILCNTDPKKEIKIFALGREYLLFAPLDPLSIFSTLLWALEAWLMEVKLALWLLTGFVQWETLAEDQSGEKSRVWMPVPQFLPCVTTPEEQIDSMHGLFKILSGTRWDIGMLDHEPYGGPRACWWLQEASGKLTLILFQKFLLQESSAWTRLCCHNRAWGWCPICTVSPTIIHTLYHHKEDKAHLARGRIL